MRQQSSGRRQPRRRHQSSNKATYIVLSAVGLVVVVVIAVVMIMFGGSDSLGFNHSSYDVEISGADLPTLNPSLATDPAVGTMAPTVTGTDFEGNTVEIAANGEPTVILFLAHWCPHCQNEVRQLSPWFADNGLPDDVRMLSVATSISRSRPNYPPNAWLHDEEWPVPVIVDDTDESISERFGLNAFPYWVILDEEGRVVRRETGEKGPTALAQIFAAISG